jgi:hypothetical protein
MLPLLRIVTEFGLRVPKVDLAPVIRHVCETYWQEGGGSAARLNLHLEPLILDLDRARWLREAVLALLTGGLSPGFSPEHGAIGVHLWSIDSPNPVATLLIADDGKKSPDEFSAPAIMSARQYVDKADCCLVYQPAPGAVWRVEIPENPRQELWRRHVNLAGDRTVPHECRCTRPFR